ncbi:hypothetical protein ALC57_13577 [Trachymyrmex cornetzi]|uniref:Uncharacterized protein n=1 Tax=Trachymyrmex cornetzi TaxID=471704 RepID=A0A195DNC9_9HYME|nr:hypothetical protein ALC57_13577 [Trachymyrmex cornetzi]
MHLPSAESLESKLKSARRSREKLEMSVSTERKKRSPAELTGLPKTEMRSQVSATVQLWCDGCSEQSRNSHLNARVSDKRSADTTAGQADLGIPARKHHIRNGRVSIESHFVRAPSPAHLSQSATALCSRADKGDRICSHYFQTNRTRIPVVRRESRLPVVSLRFSLSSGCSHCARGRVSETRGPDVERWIEKQTGKNTLLGEANKCRALKYPQRVAVANQTLAFRNMNNT